MKKLQWVLPSALLCILVILLGCTAVTNDTADKIPITTKSQKARELYLKGRDLQERLRGNEALVYHQQAIAEDPNFALAHFGYAVNAPSAKAFFDHLEKAITLAANASAGERLWIEGFKAGVDGNTARQKELFEKLVSAYPDDERAQNILAGFFFAQQEYDQAINRYEKALAINPEFSQPYNQLGYAYRFLGRFDEALVTFRKYIEVLPDDPNPYDSYAELLLKRGRFDESIDNYRKALQADPVFVASYLGIATNYNYKGDHAAAREQLDRLHEIAQNDGQRRAAHFAKTISYVFENDLTNALAEQQKMYQLASEIEDVAAMSGDLTAMGNILIQFDRAAEARAKYEASLQMVMASGLSDAQKALAQQFHNANLFQVDELNRDVASARRHVALFRQNAEAVKNTLQMRLSHEMLGRIALLEQDYDTALKELQQANQLNPYNLYRMGLAYAGKGNQVKANEWFDKARRFNPVNSLNQAFVSLKTRKMMTRKS